MQLLFANPALRRVALSGEELDAELGAAAGQVARRRFAELRGAADLGEFGELPGGYREKRDKFFVPLPEDAAILFKPVVGELAAGRRRSLQLRQARVIRVERLARSFSVEDLSARKARPRGGAL